MSKPILGANHKATRIEIVLPVDSNGDWAFDENGTPVKGRTPVSFTIPRFDCMSREEFKALTAALEAVEVLKDEDGKELSSRDRGREVVLAMVQQFLTDAELTIVKGLHQFELEQIAERIQEGSSITVGELLASTGS